MLYGEEIHGDPSLIQHGDAWVIVACFKACCHLLITLGLLWDSRQETINGSKVRSVGIGRPRREAPSQL